MVFYFKVDEDENVNQCATIIARDAIATQLAHLGFTWVEATGGQCAFVDNNHFELFAQIVRSTAEARGFNVIDLKHCEDPGAGLFNDVHDWHNMSRLDPLHD